MPSQSTIIYEKLSPYLKDSGLSPTELSMAEPRSGYNIDRSGDSSIRKVSDKREFSGAFLPPNITIFGSSTSYRIEDQQGNQISSLMGLHSFILKGEEHFLMIALRGVGSSDIFPQRTSPTTNAFYPGSPALQNLTATSNAIADLFVVKASDVYADTGEDAYVYNGSFKLDATYQQLKDTALREEHRKKMKIETFSSGVQRFFIIYFERGTYPGIRLPIVDDELLTKSDATKIFGDNFESMKDDYGEEFRIATGLNVPAIISSNAGIYFSEDAADIRNRLLGSIRTILQQLTNQLPKGDYTSTDIARLNSANQFRGSGIFYTLSSNVFTPQANGINNTSPALTKGALTARYYALQEEREKDNDPIRPKPTTTSYHTMLRFRIHLIIGSNSFYTGWQIVNILNPFEKFNFEFEDTLFNNTGTASNHKVKVVGNYSQVSGIFELQAQDTSTDNEAKSMYEVQYVYGDDDVLFQKNLKDLNYPYLFEKEVEAAPKVALFEDNVFFVEGSSLKYYHAEKLLGLSGNAALKNETSVIAEGLKLVEPHLIQTVENGVFLLASTQDEIHAYLIKRGLVGSQSYQVYRLGRSADFELYDFTDAEISEYGSQVCIFCTRKRDGKQVAIRLQTEVGVNNQYEDGYIVAETTKVANFVEKTGNKITYFSETENGNYEVYTLFHTDNPSVKGEWVSYQDRMGSQYEKTMRFLTLSGLLSPDGKVALSVSFDGGGYIPVGEATYSNTNPNALNPKERTPIGVDQVGTEEVGGELSDAGLQNFDITLPIPPDLQKTFISASVKLDFTGSYAEVSGVGIGALRVLDRDRLY